MTTSLRPNPAEVCRERGWKAGDEIKDSGGFVRMILHVSESDWIVLRAGHIVEAWNTADITAWTKVEPKPVVTTYAASDDDETFLVSIDARPTIRVGRATNSRLERNEHLRVIQIMALAGKAAIEGADAKMEPVKACGSIVAMARRCEARNEPKPEPVKVEEGPVWTTFFSNDRWNIQRNGKFIGNFYPEISADNDRTHATEFINIAILAANRKQPRTD